MVTLSEQQYIEGYEECVRWCQLNRPHPDYITNFQVNPLWSDAKCKGFLDGLNDYREIHYGDRRYN
jgi:hypothetical protein